MKIYTVTKELLQLSIIAIQESITANSDKQDLLRRDKREVFGLKTITGESIEKVFEARDKIDELDKEMEIKQKTKEELENILGERYSRHYLLGVGSYYKWEPIEKEIKKVTIKTKKEKKPDVSIKN